jgi:hypothetical protein
MFDNLGLRLPIKRVIVGPGSGQDERAALVKSLLGDIQITLSQSK